MIATFAAFGFIFPAAATAQGSDTVTYRVRAAEEVTVSRAGDVSTSSHLFTASGESTLNWKERIKVGAAIGIHAGPRDVRVRTREAYTRWSALPCLDLEAGRRIVKWGTGYGFTPTGILDPRRDPRDPQDRLGMNEGVTLAKADVYAGTTSVTIVASEKLQASRIRTTIGGVEVAMIGAVGSRVSPSWGANFTHVIGDRFEWHGELLSHEQDATRERGVSALIGGQYTFGSAANVVLEYYRAPGADFLFTRISRGPADLTLAPEVIVIVRLRDHQTSIVPTLSLAITEHVQIYGRGTFSSAPRSGTLTTGLSVRF